MDRVLRNKNRGAIYLPTDEETATKNPSTMEYETLVIVAPVEAEEYTDIEEKS